MKAHLAKVSLALLSTVFLLGCQDMGSGPVGLDGLGPEFKKCDPRPCNGGGGGGGGGGIKVGKLGLADGMTTTDLHVFIGQDSDKKLTVNNTDFTHNIQMNFTKLGDCVGFKATKSGMLPSTGTNGEVAKLVAELTAKVTSGFFEMQIDRTRRGETSDDHGLLVSHDGTFAGPTGHTRIMLGSPFSQVDPVTVTEVNGVFTFTGPVVVWAHGVGGGGGAKSDRIIQCPGTGNDPNKVTATLTQ